MEICSIDAGASTSGNVMSRDQPKQDEQRDGCSCKESDIELDDGMPPVSDESLGDSESEDVE